MEAYLAGLLMGDGTRHLAKNGSYTVWIDQHKRNIHILNKAVEIMRHDGFNVFVYKVPDNKFRAFVSAKRLFLDFGNIRDNPAKYFATLSLKDKKKFVSGFFDAEGTVTDRLVLYNGDLKLLKEIKNFLSSLGMVCYIYRFGKIWGVQIYQKKSVEIFLKEMKCIKTSRLPG